MLLYIESTNNGNGDGTANNILETDTIDTFTNESIGADEEYDKDIPAEGTPFVGNTGLTQEQINNGDLETTKRRVNGNTPYDYAYLIQAATSLQNGAIKEEFFKGNSQNVDEINLNIKKLKQDYASRFQYGFRISDFPGLDNENLASAFSSYSSWTSALFQYFPNLV